MQVGTLGLSAKICIKYRKVIPCAKSLFAQNAHYNGYLPLFWAFLTILMVVFCDKITNNVS
jgi:hypothetical protein